MSELVPFDSFSTAGLTKLAYEVNGLVTMPGLAEHLDQRHFWGVLSRYGGSRERAVHFARRARQAHRQYSLGAFAIVSDEGHIQGLASILPLLGLDKHRLPLPPRVPQGPLKKRLSQRDLNPNVAAWVASSTEEESLLGMAYSGLRDLASTYKINPRSGTWTIEPVRSPDSIHSAIHDAGFLTSMTARFNDEESKRHIPLVSKLYTEDFNA